MWRACLALEKVIPAEGTNKIRVDQVKSKFGGLRFYVTPLFSNDDNDVYDKIHHIISRVEDLSWAVCMRCGTTVGKNDTEGMCPPCREKGWG